MYGLLIAQDSDDSALLSAMLQCAGYAVELARDVEKALAQWSRQPGALIVLAPGDRDALAAVCRLREAVTAEPPLLAVVSSFDPNLDAALRQAGADEILVFSARHPITQIRALMRRALSSSEPGPRLSFGALTLDAASRAVHIAGRAPIALTPREFRVLHVLMVHKGKVLRTEDILEQAWGQGYESGAANLVRNVIHDLRRKVEPDPKKPRYIMRVPGVGYTLATQER